MCPLLYLCCWYRTAYSMMVVGGGGRGRSPPISSRDDRSTIFRCKALVYFEAIPGAESVRVPQPLVMVAQGGVNLPEGSRTATSDLLLPPITLPNHSY
ncbi:hypothetical protein EDD85DRAFT_394431 [Armillaria nabsnona]|nr:hypothetical protein EDD85DRAFT_394431 [Armillaria nabsnona]